MKKYAYINGKIVDIRKPAVMTNDIGLLRGYGVFDFMRTYNGKIFHYGEHFSRFQNSAKMLDLKVPLSKGKTEVLAKDLLKKTRPKKQVSDWF